MVEIISINILNLFVHVYTFGNVIEESRGLAENDPDLVTPEVIDGILEEELGKGYQSSFQNGFLNK